MSFTSADVLLCLNAEPDLICLESPGVSCKFKDVLFGAELKFSFFLSGLWLFLPQELLTSNLETTDCFLLEILLSTSVSSALLIFLLAISPCAGDEGKLVESVAYSSGQRESVTLLFAKWVCSEGFWNFDLAESLTGFCLKLFLARSSAELFLRWCLLPLKMSCNLPSFRGFWSAELLSDLSEWSLVLACCVLPGMELSTTCTIVLFQLQSRYFVVNFKIRGWSVYASNRDLRLQNAVKGN